MNPRRRLLLAGLIAVLAGTGVWFARRAVFRELDRQQWSSEHPTESPTFDVARLTRWDWNYPASALLQRGEAQCTLVLDRHSSVPFRHYERETMPLRLQVIAVQLTGSDRRQVLKTLFPVDRPDVGSSYSISSFGGDQVRHTIGTVQLDPAVQTIFTIQVEVPDAALEAAHPRLEVVGAYDYAALVPGGILLLARDAVAAGIGLALVGLGVLALRRAGVLGSRGRPTRAW
jgi:hypothetical protein